LAAQLRRLALPVDEQLSRVIAEFDCVGATHLRDPVAENVSSFLTDRRYEPGLRHGISATYLFIDGEADPLLVGYTTLTFDSVRLTNAEKQRMEDVGFSDFGALRIQMFGVDHRHQGIGFGTALLQAVTGLARKVSQDVATRFLLADANVRKVEWYEGAGFVPNTAERYRERPDPERSVSMRLDLLDALPDAGPTIRGAATAESTGQR
jgi:GNAT superfamily N-acetyltransferase